ncbi:MAG: hypothetical protein KatS3mg118_1701 [Paracoccaceae bacterium]|nr:MAG: thioredoxin family protein [Alphaproteobacteria bacterium]GIX13742.1 MAG: hypothetical protein KatS3mg118_1701 [Paracoccaceae bacterium]
MRVVLALLCLLLPAAASAELRLVMFEQEWCSWCRRWDREVGDAYALTEEGRRAPLWRIDLDDGVPEGVRLVSPPRFTPTFVLISDGVEIGRIEGYPGEDFFWMLLDELLARAP